MREKKRTRISGLTKVFLTLIFDLLWDEAILTKMLTESNSFLASLALERLSSMVMFSLDMCVSWPPDGPFLGPWGPVMVLSDYPLVKATLRPFFFFRGYQFLCRSIWPAAQAVS